jgi:hypothetical protein
MPVDNGLRSTTGVVACLTRVADGKTRLVFDDVKSDSESKPTKWTPTVLFTWKELDFAQLKDLKLNERELAQIGENLLIRLLALRGSIS